MRDENHGSDNPSSESRAVLARAMPSRDGLKTSEAQSIPLPLLRVANHLVCDFFLFRGDVETSANYSGQALGLLFFLCLGVRFAGWGRGVLNVVLVAKSRMFWRCRNVL